MTYMTSDRAYALAGGILGGALVTGVALVIACIRIRAIDGAWGDFPDDKEAGR